jgi:hypothetical protein
MKEETSEAQLTEKMMMMAVHLDGLAPYQGAVRFQCRWQGFQHHVMANQPVTAEFNHN